MDACSFAFFTAFFAFHFDAETLSGVILILTDEDGVFISKAALEGVSQAGSSSAARRLLAVADDASAPSNNNNNNHHHSPATVRDEALIDVNPLGLRSYLFTLMPDTSRLEQLLPFLQSSPLFSASAAAAANADKPRAAPKTDTSSASSASSVASSSSSSASSSTSSSSTSTSSNSDSSTKRDDVGKPMEIKPTETVIVDPNKLLEMGQRAQDLKKLIREVHNCIFDSSVSESTFLLLFYSP